MVAVLLRRGESDWIGLARKRGARCVAAGKGDMLCSMLEAQSDAYDEGSDIYTRDKRK